MKTANHGVLTTLAHGDVRMTVQTSDRPVTIVLKDCLHAPGISLNLLSVGMMQECRMDALFPFGITSFTYVTFPDDSLLCRLSFTADVLH